MVNQDFNIAFGAFFLPCLKFVVLTGLVISSFTLIRLQDELNTLSSFLIPTIFASTVILSVPTSMVMSSLYELSEGFGKMLTPCIHQCTGTKAREYFEFQLSSCPNIRCKVGNMYYMEAEAKLTMFNNVVNGLVFLLVNT